MFYNGVGMVWFLTDLKNWNIMNLEECLNEYILNEYVVPMNYSLKDWKKTGMSPKEYNEKHSGAKWKVAHGHAEKRNKVGDTIKGDLSYEKAQSMHTAIIMNKG